jgi:hypothetical protein
MTPEQIKTAERAFEARDAERRRGELRTAQAVPLPVPFVGVEPLDLWGKFVPPALPRGILPDVIERFSFEQGRTMGSDMAGIAVSALAVCAAAIPDKVRLQVKRHNPTWQERACFWGVLVGPPSTKKTPIMSETSRPLRKIDRELSRQYAYEKELYDNLAKEEKATRRPPKLVQLVLHDATVEAAQEILKDSPDGVLCYQDELSGWIAGMDKYTGGKGERSFWIRAYNGGDFKVARVGRGYSHIENLSISLLGGIQPEPIRRIAADSADDGLLQRFCPVILRPAVVGFDEPLSGVVGEYEELVERLRCGEAVVLRFDDGAQAYREDLERRHLWLTGLESLNSKLATHIGKYDGIFARLCVIWHCAENAYSLPPIISEGTARRAGEFLHKFLLRHAIAFYAGMLGLSSDHDAVTAIAGYILARKLTLVSSRDIKRGDRIMRGLIPKEIPQIMEHLEALGWVQREPGPQDNSLHWRVNPAVHHKFAERAKAEAERRDNDRKMIVEVLGGKQTPD